MPRDIYSRLNDIDEPTLRAIAGTLEIRGRHPQQVAIRNAYLDKLGDLTGRRILDVGCGTGVATRDLARRAGSGGQVVGVDPTPALIEVAEQLRAEQGIANATFQAGDGRDLPFEDGSFDLVAAVTVLSHVPHREDVLREMMRVARTDGTFLIVDGDFAGFQVEHPERDLTARIVDAWRATTVDDPRLMRRIVPLVVAAGLKPVSVDGHIHLEAGQVDVETSFVWHWCHFAVRQALGAQAVTQVEADRWTEQLGDLNERGAMYGAFPFVSVVARRT